MVVGGCRWFWVVPCFSTYGLCGPTLRFLVDDAV